MDHHVKTGTKPMTEEHVWWLVNPSSKNLHTLQRNPSPIVGKDGEKMGLSPDLYNRGLRDHGIRLSLVAAYMNPKSNNLRELPLTRCIAVDVESVVAAVDVDVDVDVDVESITVAVDVVDVLFRVGDDHLD